MSKRESLMSQIEKAPDAIIDELLDFAEFLKTRRLGNEHEEWTGVSEAGLASAYGEDERGYPVGLIKDPNPEYEGR